MKLDFHSYVVTAIKMVPFGKINIDIQNQVIASCTDSYGTK